MTSRILLLGLLALAAALRVPGLLTDFWLDEIWTLKIVLGMDSAWDVFTEVRHSNNHHLNTLWYWVLGDLQSWVPYRLPALLAGIASIGVAWRIGARGEYREAAVAAGLCAVSYLLVHFSSDARGYALVVFFGLVSFDLLAGREARDRGAARPLLFFAVAVLGFLSHLMYLHVFLASAAFAALRFGREGGLAAIVREGARWLAAPALFVAVFYWLDVRLTKIGDGPELDAVEVFVRALSYALGGPPAGALAVAVALATVGLFAGAVFWWWRAGRDEWLFLAVVVFLSPALTFLVLDPDVFFVRYFLLATVFGLVALAAPLASALATGGARRALAAALLGAIALGNGLRLADFYRHGRGDYLSVVRMIGESASSRLPTVGSDHKFRNSNVIRFYNRYLPPDRRLVYTEPVEGPDWMLLHRIGALGRFAPEISRGDRRYALVKVARYSDLSGWHWLAYRRQP